MCLFLIAFVRLFQFQRVALKRFCGLPALGHIKQHTFPQDDACLQLSRLANSLYPFCGSRHVNPSLPAPGPKVFNRSDHTLVKSGTVFGMNNVDDKRGIFYDGLWRKVIEVLRT